MLTLTKLAGYDQNNLEDKVAEAMDYMESYGIDAIGGLTLLANTDADLNIVDEKVAAIAETELDPEQANVLAEVAEYLGGVDEKVASIALDISANAEDLVEKVASYAEYAEEVGMPFEDAMVLANASTEDGIDEKVANEAVAVGYTDDHLDFSEKIAQAIYDETGLTPDEALTIYKEAATLWDGVKAVGRGVHKAFTTDHRDAGEAIKRGLKSYKDRLTGKQLRRTLSRHGETINKGKKEKEALAKGQARAKKNLKAGKITKEQYDQKINTIKRQAAKYRGLNSHVTNAKNEIRSEKLKTLGTRGATAGAIGYAGYKGYQATQD